MIVSLILSPDGAPSTVGKLATTPAEAERLDREATVLAAARHPGIVRLQAARPSRLEVSAVTGWCLADLFRLDPAEVAGLGCAVATILGDLHDIGVVHGSVEAGHVLIGHDGRPVLCSLGHGRHPHLEVGPKPSDDVMALIEMLSSLLPEGAAADGVRRALRPGWRLGPSRFRRVPTARRLATRLAAVPGARLPDPAGPHPAHATPAPMAASTGAPATRRKWWLVGATVLVLLATGVFLSLRRPSSGVCPTVDRGCRPIDHESGEIVTDSGRFLLGDASGNPLVLGRWTCGPALPALLRLDRGEVWIWDRWPADGAAMTARLAGRVEGAETLRVSAGASGCDDLTVISRGGRITTLAGKMS